jgi:uncharacterized protein
MAGTLYQLGDFQFNLAEGSPNTVERELAWRWPQQDRIGRKPAVQFVGPDAERITLDGVLYPGQFGKQRTIDDLKAIADKGKPLPFTDGLGRVYPRMVILSIRESREVLMDNGAARRIAFTIALTEYGEDAAPGAAGIPNAPAGLSSYINAISGAVGALSPFQGAGSPFSLTSWTNNAGVADFIAGATGAGYDFSQLAGVAQAVGGAVNVPGALGSLGLNPLSSIQDAAWQAIGISGQGLLNAALQGQAPSAASLALGALQTAGQGVLSNIAGEATAQLTSLVQQAGTMVPFLNVDPAVTQRLVPDLILD